MNMLAFDTCFPALTVAVGRGIGTPDVRVTSRSEPMATGHAERLMPLISELLHEAGLPIEEIDRIVVTTGPGSFTGTRIGIAAARALKLAVNIPVVAISSLRAIALSPAITPLDGEDIAVAVDAHRGEAYVELLDGATRQSVKPPHMLALVDLALLPRGRPLVAVGTAADTLALAIGKSGDRARVQPGIVFPDMAAAIAHAAHTEPVKGAIEPLYLRPPDAKPQEGKTLERAGA
ncbi:MAG: tRNA (adenosine(37)-N6)-threonylcarbamoyltransferase complex dimerization subunit type 1 TsaB [Deltaproteobacteria bacterium]